MDQIFRFKCSALPEGAALVGFRGTEEISSLYHFDVFLSVSNQESFELTDALWFKATLSLDRGGDGEPYDVHGMVAGVELLHETESRALLRVELAPRMAQLGLSLHSRVFTRQKIPDILKKVLEDEGFGGDDFELRLSGSYEVEEHVCQYKESNLDFIARWMEHEGMYFFFEQGSDVEKLIITDDASRHPDAPRGPVRYHPVSGADVTAEDSFEVFACRVGALPSRVKLKDYDYAKPTLDVSGESSVKDGNVGDVIVHGARFFTPAAGARLAKIRAEERAWKKEVFRGEGTVFHMRPGYIFSVDGHTIAWMNERYLCLSLKHEGNLAATTPELQRMTGLFLDDVYRCSLTAIRAGVVYRAPRRTPRPNIRGFLGAVVDGAGDGDYGQVDDDGRYRIKLHFDESDLKDGSASTAARMMQPHAGNPEGFHFPLRKGTEVLVGFLGGDPDRPFLAGAVPNAHTPSPVTSKNNTRNIIHTGSDNHLELEDLDGKQWIDIKTPPKDTFLHLGKPHDGDSHYIVANTEGDALFEIGSNQDINVGGNLTETVKGAVKETYKTSQTSLIDGPQITIVDGAVQETYGATQTTKVSGPVIEVYSATQDTKVSASGRVEEFNSGQITIASQKVDEKYTSGQKKKVTGPTIQSYSATLDTKVTGATSQLYGSGVLLNWGATTGKFASLNWVIPGGAVTLTPKFEITIPRDLWNFLSLTSMIQVKIEITGLIFALTGIKNEVVGVSLGANGVKREAFGVGLAAVGVDLGIDIIENVGQPVQSKTFGLYVLT